MPSVRFARDKRGYEYVYLVHTPVRRGKPGKTRVLYWYRTPPGIRIGRQPFDSEVQRTLEQQNPGVTFDWQAIISTPMPPPDMTEYWRERRRAEKAARQERRAMEAGESAAEAPEPDETTAAGPSPIPVITTEEQAESTEVTAEQADHAQLDQPESGAGEGAAAGDSGTPRKRRRRRGGRRRRGQPGAGAGADVTAADGSDPADSGAPIDDDQDEPSESDNPASEEE